MTHAGKAYENLDLKGDIEAIQRSLGQFASKFPELRATFGEDDAKAIRQSAIHFAFEFPELLAKFREADAKANCARDRNRRNGIGGLLLVLTALLIASVSLFLHGSGHGVSGLGYIAAFLGIIGTCLGLWGMRRNSERHAWLTSRVTTETLRQFHFYYIAARLPEIEAATGDPQLRQQYLSRRKQALDHLMATELRNADAALTRATDPRSPTLFPAVQELPATHAAVSAIANSVFNAWRIIRLDWQWTYCETKLAHHRTGRRLSPRQLEHTFSNTGWVCIGTVVLLHLAQLATPLWPDSQVWLELAVICVALIALGLRALEDGLKPQREVERYEQYRATILAARERFDVAHGAAARLEVMRGFEQASFEEMRLFLRSHAKVRFLL